MTIRLHERLAIWGVTALLGSAAFGGALFQTTRPAMAQPAPVQTNQSFRKTMGFDDDRIGLTREVAAQKFLLLLSIITSENLSAKPDQEMMSSFSISSENDNLPVFLFKLSQQAAQAVTVRNEGDKVATVVVESRPLVLVREGQSWGVDVGETYAKWNNLEGAAKTAALAEITTEFKQERDVARRRSCQSNLKQISLGLMQYAQDYDEKYPDAQKWIDKLQPYVKSEKLFSCPSVSDPAGYGYAFNFNLSLQSLAALDNVSQTVSLYETTVLERNVFGIGEEPAFRHQDGANYAFADGHVKWLAKAEKPSFKLKP